MKFIATPLAVLILLLVATAITWRIAYEAGAIYGACRVVTEVRPDLDWSKECGK